jgi:UDP-3-O-[3-hydroxymyristoyl] glucosamine N-acyltransferase
MERTLAQLATIIRGTVEGNAERPITGVASPQSAGPGDLTFAEKAGPLAAAIQSDAGAILVWEQADGEGRDLIRVAAPRVAFATLMEFFHPEERPAPGVHETAFVDPSATLGTDVSVGPNAVVYEDAVLGDRVVVDACAVVGPRARIGADSRIHSLVSIYRDVTLGKRVIVHSGTVLGADGFGFVPTPQGRRKMPQVGVLTIEDDVEIGANTCVDRATLDATIIRRGTKIDNLVQIAHNVEIGEDCSISGQTGISGTTTLGKRVILGGNVGLADHVTVGDDVVLAARAGLAPGKVVSAGVYWGAPAVPLREAKRNMLELRKVGKLFAEVKELKKRLEELEHRE